MIIIKLDYSGTFQLVRLADNGTINQSVQFYSVFTTKIESAVTYAIKVRSYNKN